MPLTTRQKIERLGTQPLRILVVDDEEACWQLMRNALTVGFKNCEIEYAQTADVALTMLESGSTFDLILVDQLLPGMLGHKFIEKVSQRWPTMPTILLSGYDFQDEDKDGILHCGARAVIRKPLSEHIGDIERALS